MIVGYADEMFAGRFKRIFQYNLLIPVHAFSMVNKKAIRNGLFHWYLNKLQKTNSAEKVSLNQWPQGSFLPFVIGM